MGEEFQSHLISLLFYRSSSLENGTKSNVHFTYPRSLLAAQHCHSITKMTAPMILKRHSKFQLIRSINGPEVHRRMLAMRLVKRKPLRLWIFRYSNNYYDSIYRVVYYKNDWFLVCITITECHFTIFAGCRTLSGSIHRLR